MDERVSRRESLALCAAAGSTVTLAGCIWSAEGEEPPGPAIEPGTSILFEAFHEHWVGAQPDSIADEENPAIVLEADADYELGWRQGDGGPHNIELWNDDEEVIGELSTKLTTSPGEDGDWLEFTARDEMAYYRCDPHRLMQGDIYVV